LLTPPVLGIIGFIVALEVAIVVGMSALFRAIGLPTKSTYTAFTLGFVVATALLVLAGVVAILSGGVNWITGSGAERWTSKALDGLGPAWRVLHNVLFSAGSPPDTWEVDVDHVAVGPHGILVVETKFASVATDLQAQRLSKYVRSDAAQAARNVPRVRRSLGPTAGDVPITPVLVYWGTRVKMPTDPSRDLGRVRIVAGADADRWRSLFDSRVISRETEDEVWTKLLQHGSA